MSPVLAGRLFTISAAWEAPMAIPQYEMFFVLKKKKPKFKK